MNIEMYFTYVNLGLLFHFLCSGLNSWPLNFYTVLRLVVSSGFFILHNRDLSNENVDVPNVKNCNWKMIFSLSQCSVQTNSSSGPLNKGI